MINDTINPMGVDFTKDLHGHVRVETRDRWTGRVVDSQEKDNIITNALTKIATFGRFGGGYNNITLNNLLSPLYAKLLGGIMLFNGTLTESADNIYFPSTAKLVGYAGQTQSAINALIGNYNPQESVYTSNGFTSVWDFATSQANGTIASLSRTTSDVVSSIVTPSADYNPASAALNLVWCYWIGYDPVNKYIYMTPRSQSTVDGVIYYTNTIYRAKFDFFKISLISAFPPAEKWTLVKTLTSSDGTTDAKQFSYDRYENNFVYANGTTLHIVAMDGTHTTKTLSGTNGTIVVSENYYWRFQAATVYRIQKSNVSNVTTFTYSASYVAVRVSEGDVVFVSPMSPDNLPWDVIIYPDGSEITISGLSNHGISVPFRYMDLSYEFTPVSGSNVYMRMYISNYLGTIANLDSPVTKTSSQTMKITYTLTET